MNILSVNRPLVITIFFILYNFVITLSTRVSFDNDNKNDRKVIELPPSKFPEPECVYNILEGTKHGNKVSR